MDKVVYLLQHSYISNEDEDVDINKIIGVYKTRKRAETAVKQYMKLPGFKEHSLENFYIDKYELNKRMWTEGFITIE